MNQHGFRRSQAMVYRPACPACMACVPVRIKADAFRPTRHLRRIAKKNANLHLEILPTNDALPYFDLFQRYQQTRHGEGDMAMMNETEYRTMMQEGAENSFLIVLRNAEKSALAVMLADRLHNGASAVYSFYEPSEEKRSLGTELILRLVRHVQATRLDYAYLGYWIKDSRKMAYKAGFPALQRLGPAGWEDMVQEKEAP